MFNSGFEEVNSSTFLGKLNLTSVNTNYVATPEKPEKRANIPYDICAYIFCFFEKFKTTLPS